MSFKRGMFIGVSMVAIGSFAWASAADRNARIEAVEMVAAPVLAPTRAAEANKVMPPLRAVIPPEMPADPGEAPSIKANVQGTESSGGLSLVAPPAELPRAKAESAKTPSGEGQPKKADSAVSLKVVAAPAEKAAVKKADNGILRAQQGAQLCAPTAAPARAAKPVAARTLPRSARLCAPTVAPARATRPAVNHPKVEQAVAPAVKPGKLFSYVRLLNYSPHPQTEEFLKNKPLSLKGKSYWFSVKYAEGWKTVSDEEGYLQDVSFEITLMEGDQKIRTLKTPKVSIKPDQMTKGKVLGIAEVAPYRFYITVDQCTIKKKGVAELVFKLDLLG